MPPNNRMKVSPIIGWHFNLNDAFVLQIPIILLIKRILVFSYHKKSTYSLFGGNDPTSFYDFLYRNLIVCNHRMAREPDKYDIDLPKPDRPVSLVVLETFREHHVSTHPHLSRKSYHLQFQ